jgi:hypothetical protein
MLQNDPLKLPPFHFDADPDPAFHFDADPDPTFHCDADPDPTTHFFQMCRYPPMLQNDPLKLPPFHFDADPDPAFHFDADADPAFHFDANPDPAFTVMRIRIRNTTDCRNSQHHVKIPYLLALLRAFSCSWTH